MARKPNSLKTVQVTISTTPPVGKYLEELVSTGFYGKTSAEAAERLVASSIQTLLREGAWARQQSGRLKKD
jgi:hypothetical protein